MVCGSRWQGSTVDFTLKEHRNINRILYFPCSVYFGKIYQNTSIPKIPIKIDLLVHALSSQVDDA